MLDIFHLLLQLGTVQWVQADMMMKAPLRTSLGRIWLSSAFQRFVQTTATLTSQLRSLIEEGGRKLKAKRETYKNRRTTRRKSVFYKLRHLAILLSQFARRRSIRALVYFHHCAFVVSFTLCFGANHWPRLFSHWRVTDYSFCFRY